MDELTTRRVVRMLSAGGGPDPSTVAMAIQVLIVRLVAIAREDHPDEVLEALGDYVAAVHPDGV